MIVVGQHYEYRPSGMGCIATEVVNERHRARITLDDGRDIQEVPFHDLIESPAGAPPVEAEAAPQTLDETVTDATTDTPPAADGGYRGRRIFGG